jgi:glycosyltransferase involved in cell wall biosynthesis
MEEVYGIDAPLRLLPNPVPKATEISPAKDPVVSYLGRLDPIKRPWIFVALAERFPDVRFVMAGRSHFEGPGTWRPDGLPPNLELAGHLGEESKRELLSHSWVVVNTSIHEALAISLLEGLSFETPVLALVDPGGMVSRFGVHSASALGDGLDAVDALASDLERLLSDDRRRNELGRSGRLWVESTHSSEAFVSALTQIHDELTR